MMIQTTNLIDGVTPHSGGAEVKGDIGGREPHIFPGNFLEAHPHLGAEVLIAEAIKVLSTQQ